MYDRLSSQAATHCYRLTDRRTSLGERRKDDDTAAYGTELRVYALMQIGVERKQTERFEEGCAHVSLLDSHSKRAEEHAQMSDMIQASAEDEAAMSAVTPCLSSRCTSINS